MIQGKVDDRLQAQIALEILDHTTTFVRVEAILDTGFTGFLTLPGDRIAQLGLPSLGAREARLGDGQVASFPVFAAIVIWHGSPRQVVVLQSDAGYLVGMALLHESRLSIDVVQRGAVSIAPLHPDS